MENVIKRFITIKKAFCIIACLFIAPQTFTMITATSIAKLGFSGLCSGLELLHTINEPYNTYRYHTEIVAESKKDHYSDAPQNIIAYVTELAKNRGLSNLQVVVATSDKFADYSADSKKQTIYISSKDAVELEELLNKNILDDIEQKKLDCHTAYIHHELTHMHYQDGMYTHVYENIIGTVGSIASVHAIDGFATKQLPILAQNYFLNNSRKIIRGVTIIELTRYIVNSNLCSKYKELRADDGIPNKKELLNASALEYEKRHQRYLAEIDDVKEATWQDIANRPEEYKKAVPLLQICAMKLIPKNWFNQPLVMDVVFHAREEHPSHLRRALRFRKRIAKLEKEKLQSTSFNERETK
jgi:hypothetical protein